MVNSNGILHVAQWGIYDESISGDNTPTITFNIAYSSACYSVQVTSGEDDYTGNGWNYANTVTKTGFNAVFASGIGSWVALGK